MLPRAPPPLPTIIDHDHQAWIHNYYIKNYQDYLVGRVYNEYHQLTGLSPIRLFINNGGDNDHHLHFLTVDNRWIKLDPTQGITECMIDIATVVRNLQCYEGGITDTSYIVTLNHRLLRQDNDGTITQMRDDVRDCQFCRFISEDNERIIYRHRLVIITDGGEVMV